MGDDVDKVGGVRMGRGSDGLLKIFEEVNVLIFLSVFIFILWMIVFVVCLRNIVLVIFFSSSEEM